MEHLAGAQQAHIDQAAVAADKLEDSLQALHAEVLEALQDADGRVPKLKRARYTNKVVLVPAEDAVWDALDSPEGGKRLMALLRAKDGVADLVDSLRSFIATEWVKAHGDDVAEARQARDAADEDELMREAA